MTLGGEKGILVSGGVGEGDQLLDSVEFFSLGEEKAWTELSPLKVPRTEHGRYYEYLDFRFFLFFSKALREQLLILIL